jgi:Family of unknown function (DUF5995)
VPHHDPELGAIADRLESYARRYERERDSRCVFSHVYALLTRALDRDLAGAHPEHLESIRALARPFAERYFTALDAWDAGRRDEVSPGWRIVFERIVTRRTSPIEDLVVGTYAHIVHDLPYALAGMAEGARLGPIAPYQHVSGVIAAAMEDITDDVGRRYTPWIGWLDQLAGDDDEVLTDYGIRVARGMAWYNAERLLDPETRAETRRALDRSTEVFVRRVLEPRGTAVHALALRALRLLSSLFRRWPGAGR